ncbi:hypothetical protein Dimus_038154 [Dionaea muscipula]
MSHSLGGLKETQQQVQTNTQSIARLETQIGEIADALNRREVQAIMTLRNEKEVDTRPLREKGKVGHGTQFDEECLILLSDEESANDLVTPTPTNEPPLHKSNLASTSKELTVETYVPKVLYPSCLNSPSPYSRKKGTSMEDTLEVFKQVKINVPLLEAIKQIPAYAKVLKDLCTQKRKSRAKEPKKVLLTEQVSALFRSDLSPKLSDPRTPTIPITIGDHVIDRALLDLGASCNLMPYSVYMQLGLQELKPTSITLQLADQSERIPREMVEDVLVKVGNFYFPADFIVSDTTPSPIGRRRMPIILGCPFLATADADIHARTGEM